MILLPKPHSGQLEVYKSNARYRVMSCGRRWGKTKIEQVTAAQTAIQKQLPVGWFAPNYKYLGEPYRELKRRLAPIVTASNHERFLEVCGSHRIDFWTLEDLDAGRGYKYGRVIIDEAGMVKHLEEVWEKAISPTLADYEGDALFGGTPKGRNFFYELFQRGKNGIDGWESFQMPTSTNPHLPPSAYDKERLLAEGLSERAYLQEYEAEFLDDAGGVFVGVAGVVDQGRTENEPPKPGGRYSAGVDLAQTQDWTVVCILDHQGRQVYFDRFQRLSWEITTTRVAEAVRKYGATAVIDATGVGAPVYEDLVNRGVNVQPFKFTSVSKAGLVEKAVAAVQRQDVSLMDIRQQTEELQAFEYEVTASGNVRMNAPQGMHDDCVIAFCLAWNAAERPRLEVY